MHLLISNVTTVDDLNAFWIHKVLSTPLASPGMENWEPVFTPNVGTGLKDMEVVQDHCVLAVRTPAGPLGLQVVPLADPSQVYTVQVRAKIF